MSSVTELQPQSITMFSGDTKPIKIDVSDQNGNAVDLTGGSGSLTISAEPSTPVLITKAGSIGTPNNRIEFTLDPADTQPYAGVFYWLCTVTDASGRVSTVAFGNIHIRTKNA